MLIISKGTLAAFDAPDKLEKLLTRSDCISLLTQAAADTVDSILGSVSGLSGWECTAREDGCLSVVITTEMQDLHEVCRQLFFAFAESGEAILEMTAKQANLEDVFLELTEETGDTRVEDENIAPEETDEEAGDDESEARPS